MNRELDFDNVLILGQHGRVAQAGGLDDAVVAHIDRADLRHKDQFMALNWVRQTPVEARAHRGFVTTKLGDHGLLAFLHNEETGAQPDQKNHHPCGQGHAQTRVALARRTTRVVAVATRTLLGFRAARILARLATEQIAQFAVQIAPDFFQIGGLLALVKNPTPGLLGAHAHFREI